MTSESSERLKPGDADPCEDAKSKNTFPVWGILAFLVGAGVSVALIAYHKFSAVTEALWRIGFGGLSIFVATYFLCIILNSLGWLMLFRSERTGLVKTLFFLRWVRESINYLLPSAFVGGDIVGVRMLVARGLDIKAVSASIVADKTLEAAGLFFFALAGISMLFELGGNYSITYWAVRGVAVIAAVLIVFLLAQRWGLLKIVDKAVVKLIGRCGAKTTNDDGDIHHLVWATYSDGRRLAVAAFLHALAWMPGAFLVWVALRLMGHEIGWREAFVIESFTQVIVAAAFIMPAALGAQEAAYMTVGMFFGVPPPIGLALSLVQRAKDILIGIPGLLIWEGFEGRHLWSFLRGRRHNKIGNDN